MRKALLYEEKLYKLATKYACQLNIRPLTYCIIINTLISFYLGLQEFKQAQDLLNKVAARHYYKTGLNKALLDACFEPVLIEQKLRVAMFKYGAGKGKLSEVLNALDFFKKNELVLKGYHVKSIYANALILAGKLSLIAAQPGNAIHWFNKLINEPENVRKDILGSARLGLLIAHQELDNYSILPGLTLATRRYFKQHKLLTEVEAVTFTGILQMVKALPAERLKILDDLLKKYREQVKIPALKPNVLQVNLIHWAERNTSKTKG